MKKTPLRFPPRVLLMKEEFLLEQIIVPIALFVVTTDNPPEKLSWSARRIFPNIWWDDVFRNWVHRFAEAGPPLNNQTNVFRLLEVCLGRSKRVVQR
jgi:hypothetical protein